MFLKIFKYLFYIFLGYLFLGFIAVPLVVKPQLIKQIQKQTYSKVTIDALYFNPLIFQLEIDDLVLKDLEENRLFSFETLRINLDPSSLLYGAMELKELALVDPKIYLVYNKDQTINLVKILKPSDEKIEPKEDNTTTVLPHIVIDTIDMEGGELIYSDYTRQTPFKFSFENIGFTLKDFDTKNIQHNHAGLRLYSRLEDGGFIDFKSQIMDLKPFKVEGSLAFEASKLYTEWKYMQDVLKLEVADGKVSFFTKYAFNLDDLNSTKIEGLNLAVEKLRIKPKDKDKDILNLDTLYVKNATVLPLAQDVNIEKIGLYGLRVKAKRRSDNTIDWVEYTKTEDDNSTTKSAATNEKVTPWKVVLNSLALEKIALSFEDAAIKPNVTTNIDALNIYAENITLAGENPFTYAINMQINKTGSCDINGSLAHKELDLSSFIECKDLDIVHYRPYIDTAARKSLQRYDVALERALIDAKVVVRVKENNSTYVSRVEDGNISLKKVLVRKKSTREKLVNFQDFTLEGVALDTASQEVLVSQVDLNKLNVRIARKKSGVLNIDKIIIPKRSKKVKKSAKKEPAYRVKIDQIALNGAKFVFIDNVLMKKQTQIVDRVNIKINKFDTLEKSWLNYTASLRVNKKGTIFAKGKLRHTPLKQNGTIKANKLSLLALTPYIQEKSYLELDDGSLSFKVNESYQPSKKYPDLRMRGEVILNSLFVSNTNDKNSSLFSLNELQVKPFTLELFPNRLYVDDIVVDSFYVSAKIDENKTINFAKLMKKESNQTVAVEDTNASETQDSNNSFPVKIVKVDVKNGSAEFEDLSLPIKFKTNIHNLKGIVYALSNEPGDTTYVDIDGEVDKYGSTKLKGSVDSFNPKEYTDLDFNFKNLDLHAMSGYSASFAGYEIDSGKLYLDLGYEIMHSELKATNNIMIKKIKLGRELEGEGINHLPLGFVIGLLEDSDGIIDIDMPIEGNVDQPDFKYGALVWKTLGNLIAKAVTSPFKFLGSMMGLDGEELEFIAFEFGKTNITPPQREKLDKIAKMMDKRPKILLEISGTYDEVKDLKALKLEKLVVMVMKKSGDENVKNSKNALNIEMLEDVYDDLKDDDKLAMLREKLHKEYKDDKAYERAYQNALISLCIDIQSVNLKELEELANKRAQMIKAYLVQDKALSAQRVIIGKVIKLKNANEKLLELKLNIEVQSKDK